VRSAASLARWGGVALCALAALSCRGGAGAGERAPEPRVAVEAVRGIDGGAPEAIDPRELNPVLDDPRLAEVRQLLREGQDARAAQALDDARVREDVRGDDACAWNHLAGRLHQAAGAFPLAAAAFDRVDTACALGDHALLRAAQAYARMYRWDEAASRARRAMAVNALRDEARVVLAEALTASAVPANVDEAIALHRASLRDRPTAPGWVETSLRLARALLPRLGDPAAPDALDVAKEIYDLTTRIVIEAPKLAEVGGAAQLRARALLVLRTRDRSRTGDLTDDEKARTIQGWLDSGDATRALTEANARWAALTRGKRGGAYACRVATLRAQATQRTRGKVLDAWNDAVSACEGEDGLPSALYNSGRAAYRAGKGADAAVRFERLEQLRPVHRLSDDGRFFRALVAQDAGEIARFEELMLALPDDFPEGDMRAEGLFRVALARMARGDWQGASAPLERIPAVETNDRHWATAGRAAYFRARAAAALGDIDDAKTRYADVLARYPLTFYMTQAYARLAEFEPGVAEVALARALKEHEKEGPTPAELGALWSPAYVRARTLLAVGEIDLARRELSTAGLLGDAAEPEFLWTVASLLNRAGAPEQGHVFARARFAEALSRYPVGGWRAPWEAVFPRAFEPLVLRESEGQAIPKALVWAIMREESGFVAEARSPANAYGLMQIIVPTARMTARGTGLPFDESALKRPEVSIALGSRVLANLRTSLAHNPPIAIAAYNAGLGAVNRWLKSNGEHSFDLWVESIPYEETRGYIKRVLASQVTYAFLYDRASFDEVARIAPKVVPGG
jgi:soluble lytic murein transglycosylase